MYSVVDDKSEKREERGRRQKGEKREHTELIDINVLIAIHLIANLKFLDESPNEAHNGELVGLHDISWLNENQRNALFQHIQGQRHIVQFLRGDEEMR